MRESILQEDKGPYVFKPKMQIVLEKKDSMQSEKQILVDPISVRESSANMHRHSKMEVVLHDITLPPVPAGKSTSKFMSCSLPNSASSSPTTAFTKHKKKLKNHDEGVVSPLSRQHSVALSNLERLRESHLRRSKSCGERRVCQPSVDFDLWSIPHRTNVDGTQVMGADKEEDHEKIIISEKKKLEVESLEDKFKCGACLFLPGFGGRGKAVRARKEVEPERGMGHIDIVSQRVSLEKFECGSWRSSAVINIEEDAGDIFFDLPVELIRCNSVNDTVSPVTTGFVFNNSKDQQNLHHQHLKGVLKNTTTGTSSSSNGSGRLARRKSPESCNSSRHVRFSTSSPTTSPTSSCITPSPRLCKAREDFNAFLEAQS